MARRPAIDATNEYLGATNTMEFGVVPTFSAEDIEAPVTMKDAELEAFMNEPVMVTVLSGGKDNEATLLPLPLQGNRGINVAIGVTALELTLVEPGRRR